MSAPELFIVRILETGTTSRDTSLKNNRNRESVLLGLQVFRAAILALEAGAKQRVEGAMRAAMSKPQTTARPPPSNLSLSYVAKPTGLKIDMRQYS